jgi:hypothetical protein
MTALATYDRACALAYARQYWNRVASDGYIGGTFEKQSYRAVPADTAFVHDGDPSAPEHAALSDGTVIPWSALDDCTHFVSCCAGSPPGDSPGGGLPIPADFPGGPYGILGADRFVQTLVKRGLVEVLAVDDKANPGLERIAPGDLIGYMRASKGKYAHLAMYAGDGNIICHTYCRSDTSDCTWDHAYSLGATDDDWQWHLLRFTSPATP